MGIIRPSNLPAASSVSISDAIIIDDGVTVEKATPAQIVDIAVPLASQAEAEAGLNNEKRMSPLRVAQAIAALAGGGDEIAINAQTGTTYTPVLGDANNVVQLTNASAITLTVPPNSSVAFPVGTFIEIHQGGAGSVTVAAGTGVTIQARGARDETAGQFAIAGLRKVASDTWRLTGDLLA